VTDVPAQFGGRLPPSEGVQPSETASRVIAIAAEAGFSVTKRQLVRWHFDGLIQRPEQIWKSGAPGSEALYPAGTGNQVIAVCRIRKVFGRSVDVHWLLWWLGFPIDDKYWKGSMHRASDWYDRVVPKLIGWFNRDEHQNGGSLLFRALRSMRVREMLFRQLRRRLGEDKFDSFINLMLEILEGKFDGWNAGASFDDQDLIRDKMTADRALGLFRARGGKEIEKNPHLYDDVEKALILLSGRLGGLRLADLLSASSDEILVCARNELRAIFAIASCGAIADPSLKILAKFDWRPKIQRLFLLYFLALKEDSGFQANLDKSLTIFRESVLSTTPPERIEILRIGDPALASIFRPLPDRGQAPGQSSPATV
jgi:hypothetical protein